MMKRRILKILAFSVAILMIAGVCLFANSLLGNPVSKALATKTAQQHIDSVYAGKGLELGDVSYSFKDGYYHAYVSSPSSTDMHFTLEINGLGTLIHDNYEYHVLSGWNTASRIESDYRKLVDNVFSSKSFTYGNDIAYGEICFASEEYLENFNPPSYVISTKGLEVDAFYNPNEFGAKAGKLTLYVFDDTVSAERLAEILLDVRRIFDDAGVSFYLIDCVLEYKADDNGFVESGRVEVMDFLYTDIQEEGLVERVVASNQAANDYYSFEDEQKSQ
ncbi:MAG: hypothetical protein IJX62_04140 [Clostridia bacterium]|nr:hypothetical protein [Clostridia bacterium]